MKQFLSGLWMLTTISGVGCAVGSAADLGGDVAATAPEREDGQGGAEAGSPSGVLPGDSGDGGTSAKTDGAAASAADAETKEGGGGVPEAGVDSAPPVVCAFTGELVSFDLSKLSGVPATAAASAKASGVVATALTRVGVTAASSAGGFNASGWPTGALDPNKHFAFSISPPPGCKLTGTTLALDLKGSATGPTMASVGTSVDGYAHLETVAFTAAGGAASVSLAAVSGVSGAVEVHVFGFAAEATTGTLRVENTLSVTGVLAN